MYAGKADDAEEPRVKKKRKKTADATASTLPASANVLEAQRQQTARKSNEQGHESKNKYASANQAAGTAAVASDLPTAGASARTDPGAAAQQMDLDSLPASDDLVTPKKKRKKQRPLDHQSERVPLPPADKQGVHQKPVKSHPEDLAHHQSSSDRKTTASARQPPSGTALGVSSAEANGSIKRKKDKKSRQKDGAPDLLGSKHKSSKKPQKTG